MDHRFTFSVFTIEINGRPTLALQAKRHADAERLCEHSRLRTTLSTITSHGTPLCDASATIDPAAEIGPFVVIGARSRIAAGGMIGPGCVIGEDPDADRERFPFVTESGIVVVPKGTPKAINEQIRKALVHHDPANADAYNRNAAAYAAQIRALASSQGATLYVALLALSPAFVLKRSRNVYGSM